MAASLDVGLECRGRTKERYDEDDDHYTYASLETLLRFVDIGGIIRIYLVAVVIVDGAGGHGEWVFRGVVVQIFDIGWGSEDDCGGTRTATVGKCEAEIGCFTAT